MNETNDGGFEASTQESIDTPDSGNKYNGIYVVRKLQAAQRRGHALNALYGNVTPDMAGKTEAELRDIAGLSVEEVISLSGDEIAKP